MDIQRIYLAGGEASAMVHHRPSHGQLKAIYRAAQANIKAGKPEESLVDTILILGVSWEVKGDDGAELPFNKAGIDAAPGDTIMELSDKIEALMQKDELLTDRLIAVAEQAGPDHPLYSRILELAEDAVVKPEKVPGN